MRTILLLLSVAYFQAATATTYYFSSSSGDDSRSFSQARSSSTPWKSLSKLNSVFSSLQPGDVVFLKRGDTFYGSVNVNKSGTSSSPIVIGAYGSGNKPVITSLVTLSNWVSKGSGIWESYNSSLGSQVNMVLLNGTEQGMGRYPNSNASNKGYLIYEAHSGTTSITDYDLSSSPNWTGAEMVLRERRWVLDRNKITSHSGTKLYYTASTGYTPRDKQGYFIQNSIKTLDRLGEWYYNPSTKKVSVYFGSNSPSSYTVQVATKENVVYSYKFSNIRFENLNIKGANSSGVFLKYGTNVNIQGCDIQFSGKDGVEALFQSYFKIENSTISNSNNDGVDMGYSGDHATIRGNKITNTSMIAGLGVSGDNTGLGILSYGDYGLVEYNEIRNTGFTAINFNGNYSTIKNNLIDNFCSVKDDGSAIYTYTGSATAKKGRKVTGNIVMNGVGAWEGTSLPVTYSAEGIYIDNNASDVEISNNTIANCVNQGLYIHSSYSIKILNNTLFNNKRQLSMIEDPDNAKLRNCAISNNICFSKSTNQPVSYIHSYYGDVQYFGSFSGNHYARPSDNQNQNYLNTIHSYEPNAGLKTYTTATRFEYNASTSSKTISLDATYIDVKGNKYSGSITLQPYASAVLIKTGTSTTSSYPTVSITSPSVNASYAAPASVYISANASDADGSVTKVDFYKGSTLLHTSTTAPYQYTWQNVSAGNYTITAKVTDNSGKVTTSAGVSISVGSYSSSPVVSITSPSVNATYAAPASVYMSAKASSSNSTIKTVQFYNGSTLLHTETTAPYQYTWQNVPGGKYTITAKATDNNGKVTTSTGVAIYVGSSSSPVVSMTSSSSNASYAVPASVYMSAKASSSNSTIKTVQFYNGSTLLHTETTAPYQYTWQNVPAGKYTLTAKATDNNGKVTTSTGVAISVGSSSSPVVSMTSPSLNATYAAPGSVYMSAKASSSNSTIKTVQFYNGSTLIHTETTAPYEYWWKDVPAGKYTLTAKATDNNGKVTTSAGVTISVGSSSSPVVSMTSPSSNATYAAPGSVYMSAKASSSNSTIKTVEFYNGSTLIHTETTAPYEYWWKNVPAGKYTLTAKATDNNGKVTTSAGVQISVGSTSLRPAGITNNSDTANFITQATSFDFRLYPNPAVTQVQIDFDIAQSDRKANLSIHNSSGRLIKSFSTTLSGKTLVLDISTLDPGVYILTINSDKYTGNKKFVKMN